MPEPLDIEQMHHEISQEILNGPQREALLEKITKHPEMSKAPKEHIDQAIELALKRHHEGYKILPKSDHLAYAAEFKRDSFTYVKRAYQDVKSSVVTKVEPALNVADKVSSLKNYRVNGLSNWGKQFSTEQKVNAGMWGVGAVMGAFGALSAARGVVAHDEQDKAHVMWSQVGVCLLQAAVAAGCAYMGAQALHGRSVG
jgi:hypothetical protein